MVKLLNIYFGCPWQKFDFEKMSTTSYHGGDPCEEEMRRADKSYAQLRTVVRPPEMMMDPQPPGEERRFPGPRRMQEDCPDHHHLQRGACSPGPPPPHVVDREHEEARRSRGFFRPQEQDGLLEMQTSSRKFYFV